MIKRNYSNLEKKAKIAIVYIILLCILNIWFGEWLRGLFLPSALTLVLIVNKL